MRFLRDVNIVLADPEFDISHLLENKGVALNIPPFLRNQYQLIPQEVIQTRKLANRHILIERMIGLGKFNKMLSYTPSLHIYGQI